jgi:O2-independent ubiquinone biosynthesis accessory factor UbiT
MRGSLPPLAGRLAALLPLTPLQFAARRLLERALAARPGFLTRLAPYAGRRFAIDPVDCPFVFVIAPSAEGAVLDVVRDSEKAPCDARISAPLVVLLGMVDGTYDGDAVFFSRDLAIEGDTEAVLALRNALENAELDPASVLGVPEKIRAPFNRAAGLAFDALRQRLAAPEASGPGRAGVA